jgi:hypothetical protein
MYDAKISLPCCRSAGTILSVCTDLNGLNEDLVYITKINWFMVFVEIIIIYSEDYVKPINTVCGQNAMLFHISASGTCFKGLLCGYVSSKVPLSSHQ